MDYSLWQPHRLLCDPASPHKTRDLWQWCMDKNIQLFLFEFCFRRTDITAQRASLIVINVALRDTEAIHTNANSTTTSYSSLTYSVKYSILVRQFSLRLKTTSSFYLHSLHQNGRLLSHAYNRSSKQTHWQAAKSPRRPVCRSRVRKPCILCIPFGVRPIQLQR